MISIALFNNKGGVGKTTCTYAIGAALAKRKQRVLLVDGDSQCNLTGYFYGLKNEDRYENFLQNEKYHSIYSLTAKTFGKNIKSNGNKIYKKKFKSEKGEFHINLLLGDLRLGEYEYDLALAIQTKTPALKNLPTVFYKNIIQRYQDKYDYILFDMSPNYGVINLCLLMSCQYFIMPIFPDYFCYQTVSNMGNILTKWNEIISDFRNINKTDNDIDKLPMNLRPKFLGTITQNFRIYKQEPAKNFQKWQTNINQEIKENMISLLNDKNMVISQKEFEQIFSKSRIYNIENIRDYNTLGPIAQSEGIPVSEIKKENLINQDQFGHAINNNMKAVNLIAKLFDYIGDSLLKLNSKKNNV